MPQWDRSWDKRTDAEKLAIALHTQELMHKKIGRLRDHVNALMDKNKLLRRKVLKLQQRINKLNERFY
jgi:phage shock protein A